MAASLVQKECICTCNCAGHVHYHDRIAGHGATLGLGLPLINLSSGYHHAGAANAISAYGSNQFSSTSISSSEHHSFSTSTAISSSTNTSVSASINAHGTVDIVEPRVYPFKGGHVRHTHASYRRESIPELNAHANAGAVAVIGNGHAHVGNGVAHPEKAPTTPATSAKGTNSWALCVPVPIPLGLANATLESLVYTIRYASLNAGSATVQTDVVLSHGAKIAEGIMTDYTKLALYAHHGIDHDEKNGRGKGYGPPMLNEALGLMLASVPAFKNAGAAGAWSHYLDHQKIFPNVKIGDDLSYAAHAQGGHHETCHVYLFFHVYEYPGAEALRSISVDVSATWNDGAELKRVKEERARELQEFKMERERLIIMKREVELTIKRLEESVKRANEESERRIKGEEAMEKELKEREEEFLTIERKAKEAYEQRMKEEEQRLRELDEAELKAKREHEHRLRREEERLKALNEAELRAKAEFERRMKEEAEKLREISEAELRAKTEYEKRALEEETRLKVLEETQKKFKEEAERIEREVLERHAREEAEWKMHEETERKAREEAERWAKEQAELRIKEETERKARIEAERVAREEAERKAKEAASRPVPTISEAPAVADEHMQEHISKIAEKLGQKCKNGYAWEKKAHGYKCSGGGHFISFKDLGMQ